jgi:hypothetical protein
MNNYLNNKTKKWKGGSSLLLLLFLFVVSNKVGAQIQVSGNGENKFQGLSPGGTTIAATNGTLKLYASIGQPMAVSRNAVNGMRAGMLSGANNRILSKDKTAPKITATTASVTLTKGTTNANSFSVLVTDNLGVASVKMVHKKLMDPERNFMETFLTKGTSPNSYSVIVQDSWYDDIGLEYYYYATDRAGNTVRDPLVGSYFTYLNDPAVVLPVSLISIGNKIANYRMIAMPYVSDSGEDIATIFGTNSGMPAYSQSKDVWRLGTYDAPSQKFVEYPSGLTSLNRGKGYWFILNKEVNQIAFGARVSPANNRKSLFKIPLKAGWNLIGNPYPTKVNWNDVQRFQGNPVIGDLSTWNGGWSLVTDWLAFQGGYVKSASDTDLIIPFSGQSSIGGRYTTMPFSSDISASHWEVNLDIYQENSFNKLGRFGMLNSDVIGDEFKSYNPPPIENSPEINFSPDKLCRKIVPTNSNNTWEFEIRGDIGKEAVLQWNNDLGAGSEALYLFDGRSNQLIDMKKTSHYQLFLQDNHSFKIFFGADASHLLNNETIISKPFPNPTINRKTAFVIALPSSSSPFEIDMQVYATNGAIVKNYHQVTDSGVHQFEMDFESDLQQNLYYYRIKVLSNRFSSQQTGKLLIE